MKGVKHLFVGSGVRYDLAQADAKNGARYLKALVQHHVSGQLKVAPEHVCEPVLKLMKKPGVDVVRAVPQGLRALLDARRARSSTSSRTSSPRTRARRSSRRRSSWSTCVANRWKPQQVQDFMPTPMTLASDMYWSGLHPTTGEPVHVTRDMEEKRMQKALLRWGDPTNRPLVEKALRKLGRLRPGERLGPTMRPRRAGRGPGTGARVRGRRGAGAPSLRSALGLRGRRGARGLRSVRRPAAPPSSPRARPRRARRAADPLPRARRLDRGRDRRGAAAAATRSGSRAGSSASGVAGAAREPRARPGATAADLRRAQLPQGARGASGARHDRDRPERRHARAARSPSSRATSRSSRTRRARRRRRSSSRSCPDVSRSPSGAGSPPSLARRIAAYNATHPARRRAARLRQVAELEASSRRAFRERPELFATRRVPPVRARVRALGGRDVAGGRAGARAARAGAPARAARRSGDNAGPRVG